MNHKTLNKALACSIVALIAFVEFTILQILIYAGAAPPGGVDSALSMLLTAIVYIIASIVCSRFKKFRISMWIAICAFVFLCIFVFYAKTIVDILTFVVLLFGLLVSMTILNEKIQKYERHK